MFGARVRSALDRQWGQWEWGRRVNSGRTLRLYQIHGAQSLRCREGSPIALKEDDSQTIYKFQKICIQYANKYEVVTILERTMRERIRVTGRASIELMKCSQLCLIANTALGILALTSVKSVNNNDTNQQSK